MIPTNCLILGDHSIQYNSKYDVSKDIIQNDTIYSFLNLKYILGVRWFYLKYISTGYSKRSCTFGNTGDVDDCGWLVSGVDRYKWTLYSGKTPTTYTGPARDHTTASGKVELQT